jgi:hypothetical protein
LVQVGPFASIGIFGIIDAPHAESSKIDIEPVQVPFVGTPHVQGEQ